MELEEAIKECRRIIFEYGCIRENEDGRREDLQALQVLLNHLTKQEKIIENAKEKIKSLELECELCNFRNLLDCETQCTIGSNKKCLKELMEVDNE